MVAPNPYVKSPFKPKPKYDPYGRPAYMGGTSPTNPVRPNRVLTSTGKQGPGGPISTGPANLQYTSMLKAGIANQRSLPGGGNMWWLDSMTPTQRADLELDPNAFKGVYNDIMSMMTPETPLGTLPNYPGSGGSGGGGGGGGGAPAGMSQEMFDYLSSILGQGKPQNLTAENLDLPEPTWDNALYGQARTGVQQGIEGIRGRANTAYDNAQTGLDQYRNPYGTGLQASNPDQYAAMERMAQANGATGALRDVSNQGVQADQAFGNVQALMAANDQQRQAGNLRALAGDRQTTEQNLGLEGNMLNLGVNMAEAKGKGAFDERVDAIRQQEAMQNWQRRNQVGDTNVGQQNQWNNDILKFYMQLVGGTAPGVTLPGAGTVPWA